MLPATLFSRQGHCVTSVLVFLFLTSLLSTESGYTYALGLLSLYSLWSLPQLSRIQLQRSEMWIMFWLLSFAVLGMLAAAIHADPLHTYEVPAKFALAAVLILCCMKLPPKPVFFWVGLVAGAVSGLAVAYWKMLHAMEFKAYGYTGAIQFGNISLTLGVILIVGLFWAIQSRGERRGMWVSLLSFGAACGLLGSYFSGTRGGWVAIPVYILAFCLAYLKRKNLGASLLILVALIGTGVLISQYSPMVQERIQAASQDVTEFQEHGLDSAGSVSSRLAIWGASLDMLKDKPVWGWGEVLFREELQRREQVGLIGSAPASLANTHNTFIEVWIMYGGLALVALIGLLISLMWHFLRSVRHADLIERTYALAGLCLVLGYVVYSQTQIMLIRNNTLVFFLLMVAVLLALLRQRRLELTGEA